MIHQLIQLLTDIFYPHTCPGCGGPVSGNALLCETCRQGVLNPRHFARDSSVHPHLDGLFFLFNYDGGVRKALQEAKFSHRDDVLRVLSSEWSQALEEKDLFHWQIPAPVSLAIVPIPTAPERVKQRGYEIPEEIFRPWCQARGYAWKPLLIRIRDTKPMYDLSSRERKENIRGCFALRKDAALPDIVILVDDICTTGSTLEEAAKVLKQAGIKYVYGAAFASGQGM